MEYVAMALVEAVGDVDFEVDTDMVGIETSAVVLRRDSATELA